MRVVGVVTVARSDYGILRPLISRIVQDGDLDLHLLVSGMHLSPEHGMTVRDIEEDGFLIADRFPMPLVQDTPEGIGQAIASGIAGFAGSFNRARPDIMVVLGDRYEMLAAVIAALPFAIPVAHIHGGESTEGLIDEAIRHCITKMSHLHFTATEDYRDRVVQMGEEPWRVTVAGAPGLDNLAGFTPVDVRDMESLLGMPMEPAPLLVTYHPVTLEYGETERQISQLLEALDELQMPVVFTYPNADTYGRVIIGAIDRYVELHDNARVLPSLGTRAYFSLMGLARAMVGNSSSGIIEAASFGLPVVNVGSRQRGRMRGGNVIDSDYGREDLALAVRKATSRQFREAIEGMVNPYGDMRASDRIVKVLREVRLDSDLLQKRFHRIEVR